MLERDLRDAESALERDGNAWRTLMGPFAEQWAELASDVLGPMPRLPRHPLLLARRGLNGFPPAQFLVRRFREERTKAHFAGLAAHSCLSLDQPLRAAR